MQEKLLSESTKLILDKLQELINTAGGKVQAFYPLALRQQYIEGWTGIIATFLCALIFSALIYFWVKVGKRREDWELPGFIVSSIVFGIFLVIFLACTLFGFIPQLLNPHYYAVKSVLCMLQEMIK